MFGLLDDCPRCGQPFDDEEESNLMPLRLAHLRQCNDAMAHARHRESNVEGKARMERRRADKEVGNVAAWKLLDGGTAASAHMLTDESLRQQCEALGIDASGGREEQLKSMAAKEREARAAARGGGAGSSRLTAVSAPANLHALSLQELRGVCAAHGLAPAAHASADSLIALLESRTEALDGMGESGLDGAPLQLVGEEGSSDDGGSLDDPEDGYESESESESEGSGESNEGPPPAKRRAKG